MTEDTSPWITIGEAPKEELQAAAKEIESKWKGRYDYKIVEGTPVDIFPKLKVRHK